MERMIKDAILAINSNAKFTVSGDDIDTCEITWLENTTSISKADIKVKIAEIEYIYLRQNEYPAIIDQLDDIFHNGIDGWKVTIQAIKDAYPKP